jgi:hypothetical protein
MSKNKTASFELDKMRQKTFNGYPIGTISYYGPTDNFATKVSVGIVDDIDNVISLERWFSEDTDIRGMEEINSKILQYLTLHKVKSVAIPDKIIGCPHEEGIDYPENTNCTKCSFWKNRDRWSGDRVK